MSLRSGFLPLVLVLQVGCTLAADDSALEPDVPAEAPVQQDHRYDSRNTYRDPCNEDFVYFLGGVPIRIPALCAPETIDKGDPPPRPADRPWERIREGSGPR